MPLVYMTNLMFDFVSVDSDALTPTVHYGSKTRRRVARQMNKTFVLAFFVVVSRQYQVIQYVNDGVDKVSSE